MASFDTRSEWQTLLACVKASPLSIDDLQLDDELDVEQELVDVASAFADAADGENVSDDEVR